MVSTEEINAYLQKLPDKIKMAPADQKIAYFSVIGGITLIILGIMFKFIF